MKEGYGVIVGRFQVHELHDGHKELLDTVYGLHPKRTIVFLGVPPTLSTRRNPLDFVTRKSMIQAKYPNITVLALPDMASDDDWSRELDKRIREAAAYGPVTLYGGRDSFVPHYSGEFKPVELPLTVRKSGEEVRAEVSDTVMASSDFRAGVIYSTQNRFPAVIACVDIAIMDIHQRKVLLARKTHDKGWRFVGGHADPDGTSFENDAKREAKEETGLDMAYVEYLGSHQIDDWRWTKEVDKVKTLFFIGYNEQGAARANDDIAHVQWFSFDELPSVQMEPAHKPLMAMLLDCLGRKVNATELAAANG